MKILYHSAAPWIPSGYGRVTQELVPRLQKLGYDIAIQPVGSIKKKPVKWHGEIWENGEWKTPIELEEPITIYSADSKFGLNEVKNSFEDSNADILFTHFDTWIDPANEVIPDLDIPYASYVIVDHYPVPNKVVKQVNSAYETISMSKFAKDALEKKGVLSTYIPHGVNHKAYKPLKDDDLIPSAIEVGTTSGTGIREVNLDNTFVFGMVAANMGDRKNIPNHMEAYKMFLDWIDDPDDVIMYIHTNINVENGYDLYEIQQELDIPDDKLIWGHPQDYGEIGDETLNRWYNAFDVLINCTYGESWGLTVTEAMSTGTPVIGSYYSTMPEQLGVEDLPILDNPLKIEGVQKARFEETDVSWKESLGSQDLHNWSMAAPGNVYEAPHGVLVQPSVPVWRSRVSSKLYVVHPHDIFQAMVYYYQNQDLINEHGEKSRDHVLNNYTWDEHIVPKFDEVFSRMEKILI